MRDIFSVRWQKAKDDLKPVRSKYRAVWIDERGRFCMTAFCPHAIAALIRGWIFPCVESFMRDKKIKEAFAEKMKAEGTQEKIFSWAEHGGASHPYAVPTGPMTEVQAIEYLIKQSLPSYILDDKTSNELRFVICTTDQLNESKNYREAWELAS